MAEGKVIIKAEMNTVKFDKQIEALRDKVDDLEHQKLYFEAHGMTGELKEVEKELEITNNKMSRLEKQKIKLEQAGKIGITDVLQQSSNQLNNIISKVSKWALAVFSVRSAYNLVRQASSTLSQYNEQYASNLEYIRWALAQAIAPVLEYVVKLAYQLLSYINTIAMAWFNVNIFSKASAKNFANAKSSLSGASKSAKELQKTLAGFDEMNILNSTSTGGGGGVTMPSVDLTDMENMPGIFEKVNEKITGFIEKLRESREEMLETFEENDVPALITKGFELGSEGAINVLEGLVESTKGIIEIVDGILTKDWDKVKQGFSDLFFGILEVLEGVLETALGVITIALGLLWEVIKKIFTTIWDHIKKRMELVGKILKETFWETPKKTLDELWGAVKKVFNGIYQMFNGSFKQGMITTAKGIANILISIMNGVINAINAILIPIRAMIIEAGNIAGKGWTVSDIRIPNIPLLATGAIINRPGRGVPLGIGGERGQEGVIPLSDSQAMETLGQAIGRYITINASITNSMNGRVISRELQKIKNVENFAFNG